MVLPGRMDGMRMFAEERKELIYQILLEKRRVTIKELTDTLKVSGTTVRLYLSEMEKTGKVIRTHGGAMLSEEKKINNDSIDYRRGKNEKEKRKIAVLAKPLIQEGDSILIDAGTTGLELAKVLKGMRGITAFTNDLRIALELQENPDIHVIILGGTVKNGYECTMGIAVINMLRQYSIDKIFLGANALSMTKGVMTPNMECALGKEAMKKAGQTIILLCDSSKIGRKSTYSYADLDEIDYLVTDENISKEDRREIENAGVKIIS